MRVLVTGGGGFLGRSVVAGLAAAGHEVVSADLRGRRRDAGRAGRSSHVVMDVTSPPRSTP